VNPSKTGYFPTIDILRGFAALSVVVYHLIEHFNWKDYPNSGWLLWFRVGWMGVDLFFVISGFVIAWSAFSEIDQCGPHDFWRSFMRRRLARIAPLHYLTCLVFLAFIQPQLFFEGLLANVATHAAFVHNLFPAYNGSINGANWSLGTEMQFYLLMCFVAPWLLRRYRWTVIAVFVLTSLLWRFVCTQVFEVSGDRGVAALWMASTQLPGMLDEFAAGMALAMVMRSPIRREWIAHSARWSLPIAALMIWLMFTVLWRFSYWDSPLMVTFFRSLMALTGLSILVAACALNGKVWLFLTTPLRYLGTISFGLYLWHLPVMLSLKEVTWLGPERALPWVIGLTIIFASVSWHFFEQPLMRRFGKKVSHGSIV
jgi:peptidoglycan/LPS O-acetylase OafA/YrhL